MSMSVANPESSRAAGYDDSGAAASEQRVLAPLFTLQRQDMPDELPSAAHEASEEVAVPLLGSDDESEPVVSRGSPSGTRPPAYDSPPTAPTTPRDSPGGLLVLSSDDSEELAAARFLQPPSSAPARALRDVLHSTLLPRTGTRARPTSVMESPKKCLSVPMPQQARLSTKKRRQSGCARPGRESGCGAGRVVDRSHAASVTSIGLTQTAAPPALFPPRLRRAGRI